jgi:hypothetical protein
LVTSTLVADEIEEAPPNLRAWFEGLARLAQQLRVDDRAWELRSAYLHAGVVGERQRDDAMHFALATVGNCDMIVSWNFKHIVHSEKVPLYNAVNALEGYSSLNIYSPSEVVRYEEEV